MKSLKDYDFELHYHLGKVNVVVDALSRKSLHVSSLMIQEIQLLEKFRNTNLNVILEHDRMKLNTTHINSELKNQILDAQIDDEFFRKKCQLVEQNEGGTLVRIEKEH